MIVVYLPFVPCGDNRVGQYSAVQYMSTGQRNNGENWLPGLHLGRRRAGQQVRNGEPGSWITVSTIKAEISHENPNERNIR